MDRVVPRRLPPVAIPCPISSPCGDGWEYNPCLSLNPDRACHSLFAECTAEFLLRDEWVYLRFERVFMIETIEIPWLTYREGEGRSSERNLAETVQRQAFTPAVILFIALPEVEDKIDPG